MAKIVLGTNKSVSAPAIVRDKSPKYYVEKTLDSNGKLVPSSTMINLNGVTDLGKYVLYGEYAYVSFPTNTSIDMSSLTSISGERACYYMFYYATGITSIDLSALTTISGTYPCSHMFSNSSLTNADLSSLTTINGDNAATGLFYTCTSLTSVDLSSLTTISGNDAVSEMFKTCLLLQTVSFPSLTTVSSNSSLRGMFEGCIVLTSVSFNKLNVIGAQLSPSYQKMFNNCYKLESVTFGGLKASTFSSAVNQLQYLFSTTTGRDAPNGCTLHFPSNFDPSDPNHTFDASTLTGYPTFGGSANYIHLAFDLPATE